MALPIGVAMKLLRLIRIGIILLLLLLWVACGDQFRPVATPIVPPPPDPLPTHFIFVVNRNGTNNPGTTTRIDVAGDAALGVATVGLGPAHAALLPNGSRVYVANSLEDTVSSYASSSSTPVTTTSLPLGSTPVFVHTTENGTMYVANLGNGSSTPPSVAAISATSNAVTNNVTLNFTPIVLSETPDGKKIYAVGSGAGVGWVVSINSSDKSLNEAITGQPIPGITTNVDANVNQPVWVATRSDSQRAYVLNSGLNGTVTTIDTFSDTVLRDVFVGAGADFMLYDPKLNRLYITNPTAGAVSVLDASTDPPSSLTGAAITIPEYSPQTSSDPLNPCQGTAVTPISIAALPDGTRAYVASYQINGGQICSQVSVINTADNTVTKTIGLEFIVPATGPLTTAVPVAPDQSGCGSTRSPSSPIQPFIQNTGLRVSVASSADSSKVYVSNCDAGSTAIIPTSTGAQTANVDSPFSDFPPVTTSVNITAASQSGITTTYTYTVISGAALRPGMSITISGMNDAGNDGTFSIGAVGSGTFNVENASGATATGQNGTGTVTVPPPQNPVFVLTGP
jgi:DNA-binding beta-propeller fold protein YncE